MAKAFPQDASVLGPRYVAPHLANRLQMYHRAYYQEVLFVDFALVDTNTNDLATQEYVNRHVEELIRKNYFGYKEVYNREGVTLYQFFLKNK